MAGAAYGLDRDAQGSGTTPAQIQLITGAQYAAYGLLTGGWLAPSSSDMSITIQGGAAVLPAGAGAVMDSFDTVRLMMDAAPATGTDIYDILISCKNEPGARAVVRAVKNTGPAPLDKRIGRWAIPAGVTNAAAGYSMGLRDNAVPRGSGAGRLVSYEDKAPYGTLTKRDAYRNHSATIWLPQDRLVQFVTTQTLTAQQGHDGGSMQYVIRSNGKLIVSPVLRYDAWTGGAPISGATYQHTYTTTLDAGYHTLTWDRQQVTGGQPVHVGGQATPEFGQVWRPYSGFDVIDLGVAY